MSFALNPYIGIGTAGGGGGGGGTGRITVGASGAMYTTITNALVDNHKVMAVICDALQLGDVYVPVLGLTVTIDPGAHLQMGSGQFFMNSSAALKIDGNGRLSHSYSDTSSILFNAAGGGLLNVDGIILDNNSSVVTSLTDVNFARFSNVVFEGTVAIAANDNVLGNCLYRNASIFINPTANNTLLDGCNFEGVTVSDSGVNTVISDVVVH